MLKFMNFCVFSTFKIEDKHDTGRKINSVKFIRFCHLSILLRIEH